jgi:hypothetical protein
MVYLCPKQFDSLYAGIPRVLTVIPQSRLNLDEIPKVFLQLPLPKSLKVFGFRKMLLPLVAVEVAHRHAVF